MIANKAIPPKVKVKAYAVIRDSKTGRPKFDDPALADISMKLQLTDRDVLMLSPDEIEAMGFEYRIKQIHEQRKRFVAQH